MQLLKKREAQGERIIAIFDIASASVGGAFVRLDSGKLPEIIYTTREEIPFQEKVQFARFLESMRKTLETIFSKMKSSGSSVQISDVFCILSSPWYASQTRIIQYQKQETFEVTEKGVTKLLEKELELFKKSKLFSKMDNGKHAPVIIESKNIQMKLNGYPVVMPFGKSATNLEIALYVSIAPGNIHQVIMESVKKYWDTSVHFSSFSFTAFDTLRDLFHEEESFLFMDISGEVTDLSLAKDGVLLESISFPAGKHLLIRGLINHMNSNPASAISELAMYLDGKSTRDHAIQIEEALTESTKEWVLFFKDALAQIAEEFPIPRRIFYTADEDVAPWFGKAILEHAQEDERTFALTCLNDSYMKDYVTMIDPAFRDPFIEIESIFAHKLIQLNRKR